MSPQFRQIKEVPIVDPEDDYQNARASDAASQQFKPIIRELASQTYYLIIILFFLLIAPAICLTLPSLYGYYEWLLSHTSWPLVLLVWPLGFIRYPAITNLILFTFFPVFLFGIFCSLLKRPRFRPNIVLRDDGRNRVLEPIFRGLFRFETLAWSFFVAGVVAAHTKAFDPPKEYYDHLNTAAPDITRTAVIALITLFFGQILKSYRSSINDTKKAAEASTQAAINASLAAHDAKEVADMIKEDLIPHSEQVADQGLEIAQSALETVVTEIESHRIRATLQKLYEKKRFALFHDLAGEIKEYVSRIHKEIYIDNEEDSVFEATAFIALYKSYLTTERLIFSEDIPPGKSGCQFVTRFVHYAKAVESVIETLHALEENRYTFYTVLNRRPSQFFNIEGKGTDSAWSDFLDFGLRLTERNIHYSRYFLANDTYSQEHRTKEWIKELYNRDQIREDLDSWILCSESGLPILWEDKNLDMPTYHVIYDYVTTHNLALSPPSYVTHLAPENFDKFSSVGLNWIKIKDALPQFHHKNLPPKFLCFDGYDKYEKFFGSHLPRDFFAVWDTKANNGNGGWCLFIGTEGNYGTPSAVKLVFLSRVRAYHNFFNWEIIEKTLTTIFCEKDSQKLSDHGIIKRDLNWIEESAELL
jgi:hypothetical protein